MQRGTSTASARSSPGLKRPLQLGQEFSSLRPSLEIRSPWASPGGSRSLHTPGGSPFLTPPILGAGPGETPPYKPDAGDYFSLDQYNAPHKRKKKHNNLSARSESLSSTPHRLHTPTFDPLLAPEFSKASSSLGNSENSLDKNRHALSTGSTRSASPLTSPQRRDSRRNILHTRTWSDNRGQRSALALMPIDNKRRSSLKGDGAQPVRSMTVAFGAVIAAERQRARKTSTGAFDPDGPKDANFKRNRAFRDGSRRKIGRGPRKDTPATITLRRASKVYHCDSPRAESPVEEHELETCPARTDPRDLLRSVSFTRLKPESKSQSGRQSIISRASSFFSLRWPSLPASSSSSSSARSPDSRSSKSSRASSTRQHGRAVDPEVTKAKVSVSQVSTPSRKSSKQRSIASLAALSQKKATRPPESPTDSLNQVIWKVETPTSGTSTSTSSGKLTGKGSIAEPVLTLLSEQEQFELPPPEEGSSILQDVDLDSTESPRGITSSPSDLQGASIGDEGPLVEAVVDHVEEELMTPQPITPLSLQERLPRRELTKRARFRLSFSRRRRSVPVTPGVESFPPLLSRRTTAEWRRCSLNDPYFPTIDEFDSSSYNSRQSTTIVPTRDLTTVSPQRAQSIDERWSRFKTDHHRRRKLGSAIGASSHIRRRSTPIYQHSAYSSSVASLPTNAPRRRSTPIHQHRAYSSSTASLPTSAPRRFSAIRNGIVVRLSHSSRSPIIAPKDSVESWRESLSRFRENAMCLPKRFGGRRSLSEGSIKPVQPVTAAWRRAQSQGLISDMITPVIQVAGESDSG